MILDGIIGSSQWPGSTRRSGKRSVFREGNGPQFWLFVPPNWPFFWSENYGWFCSVLKQSSHLVLQNLAFEFLLQNTKIFKSSTESTISTSLINSINFRRKLWTRTYLSLESYLPTSKRCWRGEFVEMKIWDLQSLLVCSIITWRISLTRDEWTFGWQSGLASLILNWCFIFILLRLWWVNWFWFLRTPRIQFLRIRCWRRRRWICKNVSRYTMCVPNAWRSNFPARHSERTA